MNCEIEFLPVGDKGKPGDAIVIRYGNATNYELMIVDGGTADTGKELVKHIHAHFGPQSVISHVVLTHSDTDHACGLREVLTELNVANLWLHIPSYSAAASRKYFSDKRWTDAGLRAELLKEYDFISELIDLALEKQTKVRQPFAGEKIGPFVVLSPSKQLYEILLPQFSRTPDPDQAAIETTGYWIGKQQRGVIRKLLNALTEKVQTWIEDSWSGELLRDGGITSASNESSVILYGDFNPNLRVLLTGDAGLRGLTFAADVADAMGLPLRAFNIVQIPHHGSRRNVGPSILNRLIGPILPPQQAQSVRQACVSAPKEDHTHPRKMVLNAFTRRGYAVFATQGMGVRFSGGFPDRQGYTTLSPIPFAARIENYD